jgi:hypothetical protein
MGRGKGCLLLFGRYLKDFSEKLRKYTHRLRLGGSLLVRNKNGYPHERIPVVFACSKSEMFRRAVTVLNREPESTRYL